MTKDELTQLLRGGHLTELGCINIFRTGLAEAGNTETLKALDELEEVETLRLKQRQVVSSVEQILGDIVGLFCYDEEVRRDSLDDIGRQVASDGFTELFGVKSWSFKEGNESSITTTMTCENGLFNNLLEKDRLTLYINFADYGEENFTLDNIHNLSVKFLEYDTAIKIQKRVEQIKKIQDRIIEAFDEHGLGEFEINEYGELVPLYKELLSDDMSEEFKQTFMVYRLNEDIRPLIAYCVNSSG